MSGGMRYRVGRVRLMARRLTDSLAERVSRKIAVRLAGVAVAGGGLALMGFGTIGTPVAASGTPVSAPALLAAPNGNANHEDVWVDNVGQPPGPGHEQDPHLLCQDINIWGVNLEDALGTYTVDGWPPSGHMEQDYPTAGRSPWIYNLSTGGDQVVSVINVQTLIANAIANGDTAQAQQGFHFKLQFTQDPQKHKTFWVNCASTTTSTTSTTSSTPATSTTSSTSTTSTTTSSTTSTTSSTPATSSTTSTTSTTSSTPATTTSSESSSSSTTSTSSATAPESSTTSSNSSTAPASTSTTFTPATGVGAATITPSTGAADGEFGIGLGLLIAGAGLVAAAARVGRRIK